MPARRSDLRFPTRVGTSLGGSNRRFRRPGSHGRSVYLATHSQNLNDWPNDPKIGSSSQKVLSDGQGRFAFPAQFERYAVVAVHDHGYAEVQLQPGQQPGELRLKSWAQIEGRLLHAGQPIPSAWIRFEPVRLLNGDLPHIQDQFSVKTDRDGRFAFTRVPPVKSHVQAQLSVWGDYPFSSSESVPSTFSLGKKFRLISAAKEPRSRGALCCPEMRPRRSTSTSR